MTTKQRVEYVMQTIKEITLSRDNSPNQVLKLQAETIERAITAAIEEDRKSRECCKQEREALLQIVEAEEEYGERNKINEYACAARAIKGKIRARSEKGE